MKSDDLPKAQDDLSAFNWTDAELRERVPYYRKGNNIYDRRRLDPETPILEAINPDVARITVEGLMLYYHKCSKLAQAAWLMGQP
jgi:hypothetical protein